MIELKHFNEIDDPLIKGLQDSILKLIDAARDKSGTPFVITSGLRTQAANDAQKDSVKNSAHLAGLAVDLRCSTDNELWSMLFGILNVGARRIGIYFKESDTPGKLRPTHIHVDTATDRAQEIIFSQMEE